MWKDNLFSRFHNRSASLKTQSDLLIPSKGSRPVSTATLDTIHEPVSRPLSTFTFDPIQEHADDDVLPRDVPGPSYSPTASSSQAAMSVIAPSFDETTTKLSIPITPESPSPLPNDNRDLESNTSSRARTMKSFFMEEIDPARASAPLTAYCFMTGYIDAVSFSALFVWCAFQTGNSVQLAIAMARLFNGQGDYTFRIADRQALCSLITFLVGAFVGRIGDKIGCKTRLWMLLGTFTQTLFTMCGAIVIWKSGSGNVADARGDPAWTNALSFVALGFISASMGLQGIMGKRLNTNFTTTVVLTTTWCELVTEPKLFSLRRLVTSRDHKAMAILFLFVGGFTGMALVGRIGDAGTLGIGTGLRFVVTLWWLIVPAKQDKS